MISASEAVYLAKTTSSMKLNSPVGRMLVELFDEKIRSASIVCKYHIVLKYDEIKEELGEEVTMDEMMDKVVYVGFYMTGLGYYVERYEKTISISWDPQ